MDRGHQSNFLYTTARGREHQTGDRVSRYLLIHLGRYSFALVKVHTGDQETDPDDTRVMVGAYTLKSERGRNWLFLVVHCELQAWSSGPRIVTMTPGLAIC